MHSPTIRCASLSSRGRTAAKWPPYLGLVSTGRSMPFRIPEVPAIPVWEEALLEEATAAPRWRAALWLHRAIAASSSMRYGVRTRRPRPVGLACWVGAISWRVSRGLRGRVMSFADSLGVLVVEGVNIRVGR